MKRFKDLDKSQKKAAVDYLFKRFVGKEIYAKPGINKPPHIQKRIKEIQEEVKFCGCMDCFNKYADKANQDSQIKEWVLSKAIEAAEEAYYPEDTDTIVKV